MVDHENNGLVILTKVTANAEKKNFYTEKYTVDNGVLNIVLKISRYLPAAVQSKV